MTAKVRGSANLFAFGLGIRSNPSSKVVIISKHAKLTYPLCGLPSALFCSTTRSHLALVTLFRACAPTRGLEVTECSAGGTLRSQPVRYTVARGRKKSCCASTGAQSKFLRVQKVYAGAYWRGCCVCSLLKSSKRGRCTNICGFRATRKSAASASLSLAQRKCVVLACQNYHWLQVQRLRAGNLICSLFTNDLHSARAQFSYYFF